MLLNKITILIQTYPLKSILSSKLIEFNRSLKKNVNKKESTNYVLRIILTLFGQSLK